MEILVERKYSSPPAADPVRKSVLNETWTDYKNHKPIDAGRLNDEEFAEFVDGLKPLNPLLLIQRFVEKLRDRRR